MQESGLQLLERRIMNSSISSYGQMLFYHSELKLWLEEAKKSNQEEIEKAWENGYEHGACVNEEPSIYHGNQYYKKTFKPE